MTSPSAWYPEEHPSGCPTVCAFPMHLTPGCLATLRAHGVAEAQILAALAYEFRSHRREESRDDGPLLWTARVEATLARCGVAPDIVEKARAVMEGPSAARTGPTDRAAYVKDWKARHKERVAEHSRAYRARKRLEVVK